MPSFLVLYRGDTVGSARLVAVSADPRLVAEFADRLLTQPDADARGDPVLTPLHQGRHRALQVVKREVSEDE